MKWYCKTYAAPLVVSVLRLNFWAYLSCTWIGIWTILDLGSITRHGLYEFRLYYDKSRLIDEIGEQFYTRLVNQAIY